MICHDQQKGVRKIVPKVRFQDRLIGRSTARLGRNSPPRGRAGGIADGPISGVGPAIADIAGDVDVR